MDDAAVRKARRQVAWLMVPVAVIAIVIPLLLAIAAWAVMNPGWAN